MHMTEPRVALPAQTDAGLADELAGLDALELPVARRAPFAVRAWRATWPKLAAVVIGLALWQLVVWSGWKPDYVLPGPRVVFAELWRMLTEGSLLQAVRTTMQRAVIGFASAIVIGTVIGAVVARSRVLRSAVGSLITGLQTMPSIAWFPLAILLFQLSEKAILFVVVIGAAPAIANGLISGADQIPPLLLRVGRMMGAKGIAFYRHVVLPASLPSYLAGLKQGWAFSWRSLMAGELIVVIAHKSSIGVELSQARTLADAPRMLAVMIVILVIGIVVDAALFGTLERWSRRRWGLEESTV